MENPKLAHVKNRGPGEFTCQKNTCRKTFWQRIWNPWEEWERSMGGPMARGSVSNIETEPKTGPGQARVRALDRYGVHGPLRIHPFTHCSCLHRSYVMV